MAVATGDEALAVLRSLMDRGHDDGPFALQPLSSDFQRQVPAGWLWTDHSPRPGLRNPESYTTVGDAHPGLPAILDLPPSVALGPSEASGSKTYSAAQTAYLRSSIDVTMKGGIASGVIYPLALCELARTFRLRNVGGASAGAIAAAFAAAAERGRASGPAASGPAAPGPAASDAAASASSDAEAFGPDERKAGRCRQGFAGLADIIAWLTQLDEPAAREEFRTAQLFKPAKATLPLFRLLVAVMRKRYWTFPILAATSFGLRMRVVSLLFIVVLPVLLCLATRMAVGPAVPSWGTVYLWGAAWLVVLSFGLYGVTISAVLLVSRARARQRRRAAARRLPMPDPEPPAPTPPLPYLALAVVGLAAVGAISVLTTSWPLLGLARSALAWLLGVLTVVGMLLGSIAWLMGHAKHQRFGLVGGATIPGDERFLGSRFSRLMGMPRVTVRDNVTSWIDRTLSDLAGQDDVLTFGHLWSLHYSSTSTARQRAELSKDAATDPGSRAVNLELMTTELVHRVPYRFPLDSSGQDSSAQAGSGRDEQFYFQRSDLETIFSSRVVDLLCGETTADGPFVNVDSGEELDQLYRLPPAWDLPVVFAVRISMSFPGLFKAVRLYRRTAEEPVKLRDDFGAPILDARTRQPVSYPEPRPNWMQEVWFSDGGIASNFPIHFFDSVLPLWPTVGINLGPYPTGFGQQDVYLPTDRQASNGVPAPLSDSMTSILGAIADTARNWRDTAQTFVPASRGRVAWVRQRSYEGGANLFMSRQTIATLALRGAVAGARLRRRFSCESQWQRHQWLRMRVGLENLADVHFRIRRALRETRYAQFSGGVHPALDAISETATALATVADPTPPGPNPVTGLITVRGSGSNETPFDWYMPRSEGFWTATQQVLATFGDLSTSTTPLRENVPTPASALRQVPPV